MNTTSPFPQTFKLLLSLLLVLLFAVPMEAQIPSRVKNRVNRNLEERILKKVDEAVDKVFEEAEENAEERREAEETEDRDTEDGTEVDVENATVRIEKDNSPYVAEPNPFVGSFQMKSEVFEKGKADKNGPSYSTFIFDEWRTAVVVEMPEMEEATPTTMIVNIKENTMTTKMVNDGERTAITMKRPRYKTTVESKHEDEEIQITPTDEYETINGYRCRKYLFQTPDQKGECWVTTDLEGDYSRLMQSLNVFAGQKKSGASPNSANIYGIEGFPMRTYMVDNKGQEIRTEMQYIKPGQVDNTVFDLSGYQLTDLSAFGRNR